ncbi:MAG: hypothetical protein LWY06_07905 [Firmicutes bacterium]|nr:hypothetical protein [Bacillota bacterium]
MICPYCSKSNPDESQVCGFCHQRMIDRVNFNSCLDKLTELGNRLIRRDLPADPFILKREFAQIEEEAQKLMDEAVSVIEGNITDISRMKEEASKDLGELNLQSFNKLLEGFDKAQKDITGALNSIRKNFVEAEGDEGITKGFVDYSSAMADITTGFANISLLTATSGDLEAMTKPPFDPENYPEEFFTAWTDIQLALKAMDAFTRADDPRLIEFAIVKSEKTIEALKSVLEAYEEAEEDEYDEEEYEAETGDDEEEEYEADEPALASVAEHDPTFDKDFREIFEDKDWHNIIAEYYGAEDEEK